MKKNDYGTHPFPTVTAGTVLRKAKLRACTQIVTRALLIAAVAFLSIAMCWDAVNPFRLINLLILILLAPA